MKKSKIITLTSAVSLTAAVVFAATSMASAAPALGDVDLNGKVTATDARLILRHAAKLATLSDSVLPVADADGSGKVTTADARLVLRYASKLISVMGGEAKYAELISTTEKTDTTSTTKKTDSSDLSTKPATKPSSKYTTAPATNPTTEPTTEPTTAPTTEPTTEPTTAPTTEPTTEPTTAPTTEPTTEPTTAPTTEPTTEPTTAPTTEPSTKEDDNDGIPADIKSFVSGKFDLTGTIFTADGKQNIRFTSDGNNLRIGMSVEGLDLDIMKLTKTNKITKKDESKFYIISEENKSYIELSKTLLSMMGMKESDLSIPSFSVDISKAEYTTETISFNGKENITCYLFPTESSVIKFYMDGDSLIGFETCDNGGNTITMMLFDSFSGEIPAGKLSLDGYKEMSLLEFGKLLGTTK